MTLPRVSNSPYVTTTPWKSWGVLDYWLKMNQFIRTERNISNYLALQQFLFSIRFRENTRRCTNTMRHLEFVKEIESRVKVSLFDDCFSITNNKKIIYNTILFTELERLSRGLSRKGFSLLDIPLNSIKILLSTLINRNSREWEWCVHRRGRFNRLSTREIW